MTQVDLESKLADALNSKQAAALKRAFGYTTVGELLWHLPRKYSMRGELTPLNTLPLGEQVTIVAQILDVTNRTMAARRGSILTVRVTDGSGFLILTFFNQPWREKELQPGKQGQFAGKITSYRGQLQLQNPDYELFTNSAAAAQAGVDQAEFERAKALAFSRKPMPVYPATAGIPSWALAKIIGQVLDALAPVPETLPDQLRAAESLLSLDQALRLAHQPDTESDYRAALATLKFHEAFTLQLALVQRAANLATQRAVARPIRSDGLLAEFDRQLPYQLTSDQSSAGARISTALADTKPLAALLQGEVGSGKTVVALRAMLQVADSGGQSALLAPTEVLAAQHLRSFTELLGPQLCKKVQPILVTGSLGVKERKLAALAAASGQSLLIIGTHALLSETTMFADLGLIIVDEQHRFGVDQREKLRQKSKTAPHMLAMTATPIPRTVALTAFGELEIIEIRQLPAGRQKIETFAVQVDHNPRQAARAWQRALEEIAAGRQVYVVCPAIEDSTDQDPGTRSRANVAQVAQSLRARPDYRHVRIGELTGQMPAADKDEVMREFAAGLVDLLVATTVVEVGVNVPNASLMLVVEAERFGVSQLHQLRGRVGRGSHPGLCLLLSAAAPDTPAWQRLQAVAASSDGFALAEIDFELRKEGDILGTAQSGGKSKLKLLRVVNDAEVLYSARNWAEKIIAADPQLSAYPELAKLLAQQAASVAQLEKT